MNDILTVTLRRSGNAGEYVTEINGCRYEVRRVSENSLYAHGTYYRVDAINGTEVTSLDNGDTLADVRRIIADHVSG